MSNKNKEVETCPCCNNPWAAATGAMFAQMCGVCEETKKDEGSTSGKKKKQFDVDSTISPADDFYMYANKKWIDANPIPEGYPAWNTFLHLHNLSQERLKNLLQDLNDKGVKDDASSSEETKKLAAFYAAAMDEEAIEAAGTDPIQALLDACQKAADAASSGDASALATALGELVYTYGIDSFFDIGASPDHKQSDHSIAQVAQGGIGLPDRDYYFDEDKEDKRVAYKKHMAMMLTLLESPTAESPSDEAIANAKEVYDLEEKLAKAHMTKTDNRDPEATYNKMSIADFSHKICKDKFDFEAYFQAAVGKSAVELGDINIRNLDALACAAELASTVDAEVLIQYLRFRSVASCAKYMSKAFVMESFDFNEKTLSGTNEIKPRWKRAMAFTESGMYRTVYISHICCTICTYLLTF